MKSERQQLQTPKAPGRHRPTPPPPAHPDDLDPHRHTTVRDRLEEEAWRRSMTAGADESDQIPGHPGYRPGGPR